MKIPVSWLREYVDVPASTVEIAERLAVSTFELEKIYYRGVPDEGGNLGLFRVGRVLEAGKHPNADRLQLCRVDVGEAEPRQIVCGAWNFGAGATVAVALPGALLPGADKPLTEAKLRGETSDGMILSERELELGTDHSGIIVLDGMQAPGTPLGDVLPLGDEVIEAETGFNRPDLLSIYGIAREVAAVFNAELKPPPGREPDRPATPEPVERPDRRLPRLSTVHRPALPRRADRAVAGVAEVAPDERRPAPDLERRRRHELRDARARQPAARVRPHEAGRGPDSSSAALRPARR